MPTGPAASPRLRAIQRTALAMLVLSGAVNTIDRAALAVLNPRIRGARPVSARRA